MKLVPPDSGAFALSFRNFDPLPPVERPAWLEVFQRARTIDDTPWPERVIVEIANTCNLDCPMCRVGRQGIDLRRVMPLDHFRRVATELFPRAREVRLNGLGESTVVPDFPRYLDVLDEYPASLELITNGTGDPSVYRRMLNAGATLLFSWDAATPALFEALRRPTKWNTVVHILGEIASYARLHRRSEQMHLLFTLQPANVRELSALIQCAVAWDVPHVVVNLAKLSDDAWLERRSEEILEEFAAAEEAARRASIRLFLPDQLGQRSVTLASACQTSASGCDRPWKEVVIRWDLDVQVCNMFNPYTYGNLALRSFERIWRGAFAQAFRAHVNEITRHPYCRGCAYIGEVYARKQA